MYKIVRDVAICNVYTKGCRAIFCWKLLLSNLSQLSPSISPHQWRSLMLFLFCSACTKNVFWCRPSPRNHADPDSQYANPDAIAAPVQRRLWHVQTWCPTCAPQMCFVLFHVALISVVEPSFVLLVCSWWSYPKANNCRNLWIFVLCLDVKKIKNMGNPPLKKWKPKTVFFTAEIVQHARSCRVVRLQATN